METTIDTLISAIHWLSRLASIAKENNTQLADSMNVATWTDVNVLINSQTSMMALSHEISVMVAQMISRKAELAEMLGDKV